MAETWLINESPQPNSGVLSIPINFSSNSQQFIRFVVSAERFWDDGGLQYEIKNSGGNYVDAYSGGSSTWSDQAYRTITFETAPTGDLLTWLQANAVKQQEPSNTIKIGSSDVNIMIGNTQVDKVYIGSNVVWEKAEPQPTGYTLNISGVMDYVIYSGWYGGSKITIDGIECSVDDNGAPSNIPHTFNNVTDFEVAIINPSHNTGASIKFISGSGHVKVLGPNYKAVDEDIVLNKVYNGYVNDMNPIQVTLTSNAEAVIGYYDD